MARLVCYWVTANIQYDGSVHLRTFLNVDNRDGRMILVFVHVDEVSLKDLLSSLSDFCSAECKGTFYRR